MAKVTEWEYLDATQKYLGWCPVCENFTTPECEPDASGRTCARCQGGSVVGAEEALLLDLFEFSDEEGAV